MGNRSRLRLNNLGLSCIIRSSMNAYSNLNLLPRKNKSHIMMQVETMKSISLVSQHCMKMLRNVKNDRLSSQKPSLITNAPLNLIHQQLKTGTISQFRKTKSTWQERPELRVNIETTYIIQETKVSKSNPTELPSHLGTPNFSTLKLAKLTLSPELMSKRIHSKEQLTRSLRVRSYTDMRRSAGRDSSIKRQSIEYTKKRN